jgi:MSHA biogenesis protein MshO
MRHTPVSFICSGNAITRYAHYGIQAVQPVPPAAGDAHLLVDRVQNCSFTFDPGSLTRAALVIIRLTIRDPGSGESVTLMQQVHVENQP